MRLRRALTDAGHTLHSCAFPQQRSSGDFQLLSALADTHGDEYKVEPDEFASIFGAMVARARDDDATFVPPRVASVFKSYDRNANGKVTTPIVKEKAKSTISEASTDVPDGDSDEEWSASTCIYAQARLCKDVEKRTLCTRGQRTLISSTQLDFEYELMGRTIG